MRALPLALAGLLLLAPSALAGPKRAQFTYTFVAQQQSAWSYDNAQPASDCQETPARGGGTQKATFTAKGKVEVTSDLARNVNKANFNIGVSNGQGVFDRQGAFVLEKSKLGLCAEPDLVLGTQGCGAARAPLFGTLLYTGGVLETSGKANPYGQGSEASCPFFFYAQRGGFTQFESGQALDNDPASGMLGTTKKVPGAQFFKKKKIVIKGSRTQKYQPPNPPQLGFLAQTAISYTLTLKPKR